MIGPLRGVRVLDFGQGVAGPYCAQLLGDHGADVIKIEPPRGDWARGMGAGGNDGNSGPFLSVNRNKRGMVLDLRLEAARDVVRSLVRHADVLVESFRPGVMDRMELGFDALRELQPRLVYVAVSGFGTTGPHADLPAGDSTMQAYGGLMSIVGEHGRQPLRVGNVVSDMVAGSNAFSGALLALIERSATGIGSRVDVSLLDSIVAFQAPPLVEFLLTERAPERVGNEHPLIAPSGAVATADSAIVYTVLAHQWERFCDALGLADAVADERFATPDARQRNRGELTARLEKVFARETTADWLARLRAADILCAPIQDYPTLIRDPQVLHNGIVQALAREDGSTVPTIRTPVRLSTGSPPVRPPPDLGQHTAEVLRDVLGLDAAAIEPLVGSGAVVAQAGTGRA